MEHPWPCPKPWVGRGAGITIFPRGRNRIQRGQEFAQSHRASQARAGPRRGLIPPSKPLSSWPVSKPHIANKCFFFRCVSYYSSQQPPTTCHVVGAWLAHPSLLRRAPNHSLKHVHGLSQLIQSPAWSRGLGAASASTSNLEKGRHPIEGDKGGPQTTKLLGKGRLVVPVSGPPFAIGPTG